MLHAHIRKKYCNIQLKILRFFFFNFMNVVFSNEAIHNVTRAGSKPVCARPPLSEMLMKETMTQSSVDVTYVTICFMKHNPGGGVITEDKQQSREEQL